MRTSQHATQNVKKYIRTTQQSKRMSNTEPTNKKKKCRLVQANDYQNNQRQMTLTLATCSPEEVYIKCGLFSAGKCYQNNQKVLWKQPKSNVIDTGYMFPRGGVNQMWIIFSLKVLSKQSESVMKAIKEQCHWHWLHVSLRRCESDVDYFQLESVIKILKNKII
jgi:hypothetical protein